MTERYLTQDKSGNAKTGPIAAVYSPRSTCPPSCGFYSSGCYALGPRTAKWWAAISDLDAPALEAWAKHDVVARQDRGMPFDEVMAWLPLAIRRSPNRIVRWGVAGDLPGYLETVDVTKLGELLTVVKREQAQLIAYTHRSDASTLAMVALAQDDGIALNVSCERESEVDRVLDAGLPCVVVTPEAKDSTWRVRRTSAGRRVVRCPAEYSPTICATCGSGRPLCSRPGRDYAIGFTPHGPGAKKVRTHLDVIQ